jgi:hypothetical protein
MVGSVEGGHRRGDNYLREDGLAKRHLFRSQEDGPHTRCLPWTASLGQAPFFIQLAGDLEVPQTISTKLSGPGQVLLPGRIGLH